MQALRRLLAATLLNSAARFAIALAALPALTQAAQAQVPHPWQIGLQAAHSPVGAEIHWLNTLVLWIIIVITAFVGILLGWVIFRFNAKRNPVPSKVSHHTWLEVAWTVLPVVILVIIAIPSFRLVYYEDRTQNADMTIKVTAHQWYWSYDYPDQHDLHFDSYVVPADKLKPGQLRLLTVDNDLVVPAGKNIRVLTTSGDVIHSFFVPSLGVQRYAIPGQTIETWFRADQPGVYRGECNQICGTNHSDMPIVVHAVTQAEFAAWLKQAAKQFSADAAPASPAAPADGAARLADASQVQTEVQR